MNPGKFVSAELDSEDVLWYILGIPKGIREGDFATGDVAKAHEEQRERRLDRCSP